MNNLLEEYEKAETLAEQNKILKELKNYSKEEKRQMLHEAIDKLLDVLFDRPAEKPRLNKLKEKKYERFS